jgi:CHAT domain-containing protein
VRVDDAPFAAALASARPGEGRLVNAPWLKILTGRPKTASTAVKTAALATGRTLTEKPTPEALRRDAVIALLSDNTSRALSELSRVVELDPSNANAWNDLSVVHLQRGSGDPYELILALAASNRAVNRNPTLLAARFNRALALERLSLHDRAAEDWRYLVRFEPDPLWRREAQEHLRPPSRPDIATTWRQDLQAVEEAVSQGDSGRVLALVRVSRQSFREYVEEDLLGKWALAEDQGRTQAAAEHLAVARAVAVSLVEAGGDGLAAETIGHIDRIRRTEPRRLSRLVAGFVAYHEGLELSRRFDFSGALLRFLAAQARLARQGSPFSGWAAWQIAFCHYQLLDYRQAKTELLALEHNLVGVPRQALRGRALWLKGLIECFHGSPTAWLTAHTMAEAEFRGVGEDANVARLSSLLAVAYDSLGQRNEAWRQLYRSLIEPKALDKPANRFAICENASWLAYRQGETEIALWFQEEVIRNAHLIGKPVAIIGALRPHVTLLALLGRKEESAKDLAQAWTYVGSISDLPARRSIEGDLHLVEGELAVTLSPQLAIRSLDKAIAIFRSTSYYFRLGQALYLRSSAELALGMNNDAERDLLAAIEESERQRERISSAEDRISYFDRTREILDTMISFQLDRRHDPNAALRFSEQAKARVLWDWILTQPTGGPDPQSFDRTLLAPLSTKPLQQDLPKGTAVIEYAVLPQSTAIWVLRQGVEPKVVTVKGGAAALGDWVQKLHRAVLEDQAPAVQATAESLYGALIAPIAQYLIPGERLVFVPDGTLHALPFTLLRDPKTRRYLVQDHVCSVAPSIRVLQASLHRAETRARGRQQRALMIADPKPDLGLYPGLTRLDSGETAVSIAQLFPGSVVLRAQEATRRAFLHSAGSFEIVHFGGHSVVNTEYPLLSQMVLAPAAGDSNRGVLYSGDILRQRFPQTRLVVLASCATAAGKISRTEGVENLARPFLAAGVPVVVASLWDVGDKVTGDFFERFYRNLRKGWDVAGALRATQVDSIEHGSGPAASPRAWAAFEVIGGSIPEEPR